MMQKSESRPDDYATDGDVIEQRLPAESRNRRKGIFPILYEILIRRIVAGYCLKKPENTNYIDYRCSTL
jgi:hypothetical protein